MLSPASPLVPSRSPGRFVASVPPWCPVLVGILGWVALAPCSAALAQNRPCFKLLKAGTPIQGEVRICPGRYRLADPAEHGVIILAGSGTRLDLSGVTLESGDTAGSRFVGVGVFSRGVDSVSIRGGQIRGYRYGIRLEGGKGHRVSGVELSGSRRQLLRSTPESFDEADWLDIFHPDTFDTYGAGLYLRSAEGVQVTGVTANLAQNGIGLFQVRNSTIADNDVSGNSGWGIHLWASAHNTIIRNKAHHNVRCETAAYSRGCDSAALLLRERSDSNLIADNDLTASGDGFFLSGQRPYVHPSIGNIVVRNDASSARHNAFESTFSEWNTFLENRADSSDYAFWLGYSRGNIVRGNSAVGSRSAGIAIEHGGDNDLGANVIIGGRIGIRLFAPHDGDESSQGYRIDDNTIARVGQGVVLERTTQVRLRGNILDGVNDALVADSAAADAQVFGNVFLRVQGWFIQAPSLEAGSNFWATRDPDATATRIRGQVNILPWKSASAAGF